MSHSHSGRQTVCCRGHCYEPAHKGEMNLLLEARVMAPVIPKQTDLKAEMIKEKERCL